MPSPHDEPKRAWRRRLMMAGVVTGVVIVSCSEEAPQPPRPLPPAPPVVAQPQLEPGDRDEFGPLPTEVMGFAVTRGAAKGYVDDVACKECHEDLWNSYQEVGMARSFYPPRKDNVVETLGEPYFHATTKRYYVMEWRGDDLVQRRYCKDDDGKVFAEYEAKVAWVIGSGNHVRTYFSRNAHGELYQLPLSWYAGLGWAMSPGYDRRMNDAFSRRIDRGCMFCHNAYPEVPVGADLSHASQVFPEKLPHGIGCQRCHGPGARHVEAADDEADDEVIRTRIAGAKDWSHAAELELCHSCHLQPDSLLSELHVHSFERGMYSYRPGQRLRDYITYLDHGTPAEREGRFQINHHAYRLRWSRCRTEQGEPLGCTQCHDPHRKVPKAKRAAHYRQRCFACHDLGDCQSPEMGRTHQRATADCVSCHMIKARPADVVLATITDHKIRRHPPKQDPTAPRSERSFAGDQVDIIPYFEAHHRNDPRWPMLRAFGQSNAPDAATMAEFRRTFDATRPHTLSGYVDVGRVLMHSGAAALAIPMLEEAVLGFPEDAAAHWALGDAFLAAERPGDAVPHLERARGLDGDDPGISRSLADALARSNRPAESRPHYEHSLRKSPENWRTQRHYAFALVKLGDRKAAIAAFHRAVRLQPDDAYAYQTIAGLHQQAGEWRAAFDVLRQGAAVLDAVRLTLAVNLLLCPDPKHRDRAAGLAEARRVATDAKDASAQLHLAFAGLVNEKPEVVTAAFAAAERLGADQACRTGLASLHALGTGDTDSANRLLKEFHRLLRTTQSDEPLRPILDQFIASISKR